MVAYAGPNITIGPDGKRRLTTAGKRSLGCPTTQYIQACKCSDGTTVDIWLEYSAGPPAQARINGTLTTLPFSFHKTSGADTTTVYTVDTTAVPSSSPGTIYGTTGGSGATTTSCSPCFTKTRTPASYTVNLSGIIPCSGWGSGGDPNGTYTASYVGGCNWVYDDGNVNILLDASSGTPEIQVLHYGTGALLTAFWLPDRTDGTRPVTTTFGGDSSGCPAAGAYDGTAVITADP